MAFFDKLSEIAKNVGEMTNDALENSRKGSQISAENKKIRDIKEQIGTYYYEKFQSGETVDDGIAELCGQIRESLAAISALQAEIDAAQAARESAAPEQPQGVICPGCGQKNAPGTKFCGGCGEKLETEEKRFCSECGAEIKNGAAFCGECGARQ